MELEDEKCVKVTDYVEIIGVVEAFYERLFKKEGVRRCPLPVALLSSDACELAPLRTVLFMCFFYIFTSIFDTCIVCNDYVRQNNTFGHWTVLH